jgi:hypothetical protein
MTRAAPYWPVALPLHMAAAYCGLSPEVFKEVCPVLPIPFTQSTRGHRYFRPKLDEWLSSIDPNAAKSPVRKFGDRLNGGQGEARRA